MYTKEKLYTSLQLLSVVASCLLLGTEYMFMLKDIIAFVLKMRLCMAKTR